MTSNRAALPSPTTSAERIDAIDALRGLALFGVMAINVVMEFRVSIFEQFLGPRTLASPINRAIDAILSQAIELKAFALFSLLFGAGLAIQFDRLATSERRTVLLVRRLAVLLVFGVIHLCLIWNGDILTEYALAGFIVLPFLFGPRWLLALASLVFLALYLAMQDFAPAGLFPSRAAIWRDVMDANRIYATGGYLDVLAFRLRELALIAPLHAFVFPRTIGLFLVGALAWRSGIVQNVRGLFAIALPAIALGAGFFGGTEPLGTIALALGYGAAILGIARFERGKRLLGWAAPLGRMAFTNYVAQSVIFGWIFYGYGLGLFGRLGITEALTIGIAVYIAQVLFSTWWLRHYRYGPLEWLWRTLMYGVRQPMVAARVAVAE
ncbi:DUF418 domain-containing protein [Bradyrhizobium sp. OK095]|uniref:DUF418 domain-containing protein n=1 Tax=Bradyrhizobium sp. OK095 TaxID=1882760 RepID=UPI0008B44C16|nr:DUF418 domain-containing protein [Bradyrhizobium sp. OK095]SEM19712.1 uncharacterized protein SAMN05443254_10185 [Bradyrhizobium sp. OK095]